MTFGPIASGEVELARDLIYRYGWNTTCYQLLNKGITRWFSADRCALVGFVDRSRVRVVAGAPVCDANQVRTVLDAFEDQSRRAGRSVCYFGAEARVMDATLASGHHSSVVLGAQPTWTPDHFLGQLSGSASLRAQLYRAHNKAVEVEEWPSERAQNDPGISRVLSEWLETRGMPPMHFLVEPQTLGDLKGRRIFVASLAGEVAGFLVASPIPCRNGWLTEQFVRGWKAPNGTVELLVAAAVKAMVEAQSSYVTMGIVPLSMHGTLTDNPAWLNTLLAWARAHGRRFYNFDGLDAFKAKFRPDGWDAIFAISNEPSFSLRSLYAIVAAFSDGPPAWALARAVGRAARQELRWLVGGR